MSNQDRVIPHSLLRFAARRAFRFRGRGIIALSGAAATELDFDICSKLAAGQIAESHRSLWRAERRLLADVDG